MAGKEGHHEESRLCSHRPHVSPYCSPTAYGRSLEMVKVKWSGIHGNTFVSFMLHSELPRPTVSLHAEPFTPRADNSSTIPCGGQLLFSPSLPPCSPVTHGGVAGTGLTDEILWF